MEKTKWEDCPRDDLYGIPLMEKAGFVPRFSQSDKYGERTTPGNPPHDAVSFIDPRRNVVAWPAIDFHSHERVWRVAELDNGSYVNHRSYGTIEEVLEKEAAK
jgi:hypothetical protein